MPSAAKILCLAGRVCLALLLLAGSHDAAEPDADPARRLEAVVTVHVEIPADARTASLLGTRRDGSGVVIDDAGLIVTVGYLITEAMAAEVTTTAGKASRADIVGFDTESGLGLLRAAEPLAVKFWTSCNWVRFWSTFSESDFGDGYCIDDGYCIGDG